MKPIEMTADDFSKVQDKSVRIWFLYKKRKEVIEITGVIRMVYLAMNPPNMPGSFDFQISKESKQLVDNSDIDVPENIGIMSVSKIELI